MINDRTSNNALLEQLDQYYFLIDQLVKTAQVSSRSIEADDGGPLPADDEPLPLPESDEDNKLSNSLLLLRQLIHNLGTYQIELEMQNEQLRSSRDASDRSQSKYLELYKRAPVGYLTLDTNGTIQELNAAAAKILGMPRAQLRGMQMLLFFSSETAPQFQQHFEQVLATQETHECEVVLTWQNRPQVPVHVQSAIINDEDVPEVGVTLIDVSALKQAETALLRQRGQLELQADNLMKLNASLRREVDQHKHTANALRASENRFRSLVDSLEDIVFVLDSDGRHTEVFGRWLEKSGRSAEDFLGKTASELLGAQAGAVHQAAHERAMAGEYVLYDWSATGPDGTQYFQTSLSPLRTGDGEISGVVGVGRDVTAHKKTELALQASEMRYRSLVEQGPDITYQFALNEGGIYYSPQVEAVLGYSPEQLRQNPFLWQESIHPDDRPRVRQVIKEFEAGQGFELEYRIKDAQGRDRWFLDRSIFRQESGNRVIIEGVATDITRRKQAEHELRNSENKFRSFVEQSSEAITLTDSEGRIQVWNSAAEALTGFFWQEVVGRYVWDVQYEMLPADLKRPERLQEFRHKVLQMLHNGDLGGVNRLSDIRFVRRDGEIRFVQQRVFSINTSDGVLMASISRDLTDRVQQEQQLQTMLTEKEVLLKEIHHRVKNNLQIVSSLLNLQAGSATDPGALAALSESQNRVRAMSLVHEKLYQSGDLGQVDFLDYARSLVDHLFVLNYHGRDQIRLRVEGDPLAVDANTLVPCGLIMTELITNALKYAFPNGGSGEILVQIQAGTDEMAMTVADTGIGLPVNTSPETSSTLGLQLVNGLVQQVNGRLEVQRDSGTRYQITIPLLSEA
ncbi:MAG: hypothetical protein Kow0031_01690 [Anaerolineae bacterium]